MKVTRRRVLVGVVVLAVVVLLVAIGSRRDTAGTVPDSAVVRAYGSTDAPTP